MFSDFPNATKLVITGIYYVVTGIITIFSVFGVYVLIRYGRSRAFALVVAGMYIVFFLSALTASLHTLQVIKNF